ncbi:MAG: glycosyltransferase family 2 protein [Nitrospiria bacterium]
MSNANVSALTISVIIPTFNRTHTLSRALDSIFKQAYAIHEIIVVDDGSQDAALDVQSKYPRVKFIQQSHLGVSAARNRGIRAATGDWIALLDSDDTWSPRKLSRQTDAIVRQPDAILCHTNELWIRNGVRVNQMKKHQKKGGHIFQHCLPLCVISPSSVLIKKTLFEEIGYFDEKLPVCEDYDLWLRICAKYPVLYLDECLIAKYGGHSDQLSRKYWGMDRFRVRALDKLIKTGAVKGNDLAAAYEMLRHKCEILMKGAAKHNNQELLDDCQTIIKQHRLEAVEVTHA